MAAPSDDLHVSPCPLLLAAGGSGRFGAPKALAQIDGKTMVERWIDALASACGRSVTVVLGAHNDRLEPVVAAAGAVMVYNAAWRDGLSASVAAGVAVLPPAARGVLLALCDQPGITAAHLARLVARWRLDPGRVVAARYSAAPGAPAIWPASLFGELKSLTGDRGAKPLFARYADRVDTIALPEAAFDIDTPDDLQRWSSSKRDR